MLYTFSSRRRSLLALPLESRCVPNATLDGTESVKPVEPSPTDSEVIVYTATTTTPVTAAPPAKRFAVGAGAGSNGDQQGRQHRHGQAGERQPEDAGLFWRGRWESHRGLALPKFPGFLGGRAHGIDQRAAHAAFFQLVQSFNRGAAGGWSPCP